jgi:hypothetical protein
MSSAARVESLLRDVAPPMAHAGHVLVDLAFTAPVIGLALWFLVVAVRDRRRAEHGDPPEGNEP